MRLPRGRAVAAWLLLALVLASPAPAYGSVAQTTDELSRVARRAARGAFRRQGSHRRAADRRPAIRSVRAVLTALPRRPAVLPQRRPADLHRQDRPKAICLPTSSSIRSRSKDAGDGAAGRADEDRHATTGSRRVAQNRARALRPVESRCRRCGSTPSRTCCARSTSRPSRCCASATAVETDAGVKTEIDTGLALADARRHRHRSAPRSHRDAVEPPELRTCGTGWPRCWRQSPDGSFVEADAAVRGLQPNGAVAASIDVAAFYSAHRNAVLRPEPGLGAGAGRDRPGDHVRRHGRHQHGARRADDARRLHDLRRAAGDARAHRRVDSRGHSRGVPRRRRCRRADRTHDHPLSLRPAARDAAGDVRRQPGAAAARAIGVLGAQPRGGDAGVDERHAADQRSARDHLQPALHRGLHADRVRDCCWWC